MFLKIFCNVKEIELFGDINEIVLTNVTKKLSEEKVTFNNLERIKFDDKLKYQSQYLENFIFFLSIPSVIHAKFSINLPDNDLPKILETAKSMKPCSIETLDITWYSIGSSQEDYHIDSKYEIFTELLRKFPKLTSLKGNFPVLNFQEFPKLRQVISEFHSFS